MTRSDDTPVPEYPGLLRLDGRRFVVLGAGQGIGRQASHALAMLPVAPWLRGVALHKVDRDQQRAGNQLLHQAVW